MKIGCAYCMLLASCSLLFSPSGDAGGELEVDSGETPGVFRVRASVGSQAGRDFSSISDWIAARGGDLRNRRVYEVDTSQGSFIPGENLNGGACSGTFVSSGLQGLADQVISLDNQTTACPTGAMLTGEQSGASATIGDFLGAGVIEQAILHPDSEFDEHVVIDGFLTDAEHFAHITVAVEHGGLAGQGVVLRPTTGGHALEIRSNHTRIEGLEVTGWSMGVANSYDGMLILAQNVLVERALVHDDGGAGGNPDCNGISAGASNASMVVRNSILYRIARTCVGAQQAAGARVTVENVTAYQCMNNDVTAMFNGAVSMHQASGGILTVKNTIALDTGNGASDYLLNVSDMSWGNDSSHNASSDLTAPGTAPFHATASLNQFINGQSGDLHLLPTSDLRAQGLNLSSAFTRDVDNEPRPETGPWDIGADQLGIGLKTATSSTESTSTQSQRP